MRKLININSGWKFTKQNDSQAMRKSYNDENWEPIHLPHTWNAIDGANGNDFYTGACWYRKEFVVDNLSAGNNVYIEFQGANSVTDVYVNGQYIGQHKGGYSTFRFDITEMIEFGQKNVLAVKVDNTVVDDVYPQKADFTFFGGIYRDVNLVIVNHVHVDLMDYGSNGIYIVQDEVTSEKASITIKTRITNKDNEDKKVRVWSEILDATNRLTTYRANEVVVPAGETLEVDLPAVIENPNLWNGRNNAYLYNAKVSLQSFNDTIDELTIPFGVRYFNVDSEKGFFLNGERLQLKGVARHQDSKDLGWAISEKEQLRDMALIKELGANSIRLAHYQHDQFFYDLCDQEGMVVWAEIPFISKMSDYELEGVNAKQQLLELIKQNINHPSIMFWGVQNEIQIGGERAEARRLVKELNDLAKKVDPTRLTTMAHTSFVEITDDYNFISDIVGYNKYYGWYGSQPEYFSEWIDEFHETNPGVSLCISEYGAEGLVQYHSSTPQVRDYTEEYHALFHERVWKIFEQKPFLMGTYVWNMFDFAANVRDEAGVKGRNNKGLVTYDRKIKKDAFYMYKAHWSDEKFVHITSKRFVDRVEDAIAIKIYSNCTEVTLYVNGQEHGSAKSDDKVFIFENVRLQEGTTTIKAVSSQSNIILEDVAVFNKVAEPNPSYTSPEDGIGTAAANWFNMPDLSDVEVKEIQITDDVYSTRCSFGELKENKEADAVLREYLGDYDGHPMFGMKRQMTIDQVSKISRDIYNDKLLYLLNEKLTKIKKS
ncbi:beta-galactosidase [Paenibacillus montaniterrae]|uniref:Beta-galactosidase n=1 Tax=Paenibacillus montaniterrae TaxID=429341 RepID=A0A919YME3_9BACL|nr:glycoside hydrolase family 2 TIM barrel-domain containing protein [Paenibacillus montaniterrae]GIP16155.1 beta-galactosidase [Paenibacillus montaniterrae]